MSLALDGWKDFFKLLFNAAWHITMKVQYDLTQYTEVVIIQEQLNEWLWSTQTKSNDISVGNTGNQTTGRKEIPTD